MSRRGPAGLGLAARIFVTIALVVLAGALTLLLVSLLVAPRVFGAHLDSAGIALNAAQREQVDEGFTRAIVTSIAAGASAAALVAVVAAALVARRLSGPLALAASTASRLADGDLAARMPVPAMGPELAALADAVNTLAARLAATEHRRAALLHDLAHELRTPLTAIDSTLEAVQDGVLTADEQTLAGLRVQTARLTRLIGDLTAASRTDEHAFTVIRRRVDLAEVARQVVAAQTARYAGAHVRLAASAEGPCLAAADPDRVAEVLDQLLDNALRHCAPGQRVEVRAQRGPDGARLVVADTGSGFPPEQAELLFERFARGTVPSTAGSGIGLTIARALTEAQGGTLIAASDGPGTGARFTVRLPGA